MNDPVLSYRPKRSDRLIQCVAASGMIRVVLIDGTNLVKEARRVHGLSRVATAALGRQLMMTAIMSADLKGCDDLLSTVIKGDGPAGTMICTGNSRIEVKGSVLNGDVELPPTPEGKLDVGGFVGHNGKLSVIRDMGLKEPYTGLCNLVSGEIAIDFANYYAASLQRPALVYLGVREDAKNGNVRAAAGIFAEPLPGCPDEEIDRLQSLSEPIAGLSERMDAGETLDSFLVRVFEPLKIEKVGECEPKYVCDCTRQRVERALISLGRAEMNDMIEQDHGAEVSCRFCDRIYHFTQEELERLLESTTTIKDETE